MLPAVIACRHASGRVGSTLVRAVVARVEPLAAGLPPQLLERGARWSSSPASRVVGASAGAARSFMVRVSAQDAQPSSVLRGAGGARHMCTESEAAGGDSGVFGQKFEVGEIEAYPREKIGTRHSKRARKNGLVPGVMYGRDADGTLADPQLLYLEEKEVKTLVRRLGVRLENTLFDLKVGAETYRVLPRQLEMHPFRDSVVRLNFIRYNPGQHPGARISIPLKPMNEDRCPALKEGGWLLNLQYSLPVFASGDKIPDSLMMDMRGKKVGQKVFSTEIFLNEGLALRTKQGRPTNFAVAKLIGARKAPAAS